MVLGGADRALVGMGSREFSRSGGTGWLRWYGRCFFRGWTGLGLRGRGIRGGLLCKTLAEAHAVVLASSSFFSMLLRLGTAHNVAGARDFGDTEVKEDRIDRSRIAWRERGLRCRTGSIHAYGLSTCTGAGA